jgi:hypothetical protein
MKNEKVRRQAVAAYMLAAANGTQAQEETCLRREPEKAALNGEKTENA